MNCATSAIGKELAAAIVPDDDFETVSENLKWTTEAVKIFAVSPPPLGGIRDIRETLEKIKLQFRQFRRILRYSIDYVRNAQRQEIF